jgi:dTDP-6-deoxy-L-talose 4-dehydrogenase (NAD+)
MKIAITGATGFIGQHVRKQLKESTHEILLVTRDAKKITPLGRNERALIADISEARDNWYQYLDSPDVLLHLAWGGLPNYLDNYHIDVELQLQEKFLTNLVSNGLSKLVVTGTCYEYGIASGALTESEDTNPVTPYGIAKDRLRQSIVGMKCNFDFDFKWARIFYPYGDGQAETAIYSQIRSAIAKGEKYFKIGSGKQKLDFVSVELVASVLIGLATKVSEIYIVNIGSGEPQTVFDFVQQQVKSLNAELEPLVGAIPDREYESPAFWADVSQIKAFGFEEISLENR